MAYPSYAARITLLICLPNVAQPHKAQAAPVVQPPQAVAVVRAAQAVVVLAVAPAPPMQMAMVLPR